MFGSVLPSPRELGYFNTLSAEYFSCLRVEATPIPIFTRGSPLKSNWATFGLVLSTNWVGFAEKTWQPLFGWPPETFLCLLGSKGGSAAGRSLNTHSLCVLAAMRFYGPHLPPVSFPSFHSPIPLKQKYSRNFAGVLNWSAANLISWTNMYGFARDQRIRFVALHPFPFTQLPLKRAKLDWVRRMGFEECCWDAVVEWTGGVSARGTMSNAVQKRGNRCRQGMPSNKTPDYTSGKNSYFT